MKTFFIIFTLMLLQSCSSTRDNLNLDRQEERAISESCGRLR